MKYFIHAQERKATQSTLYFEFTKGHYRGKHWSEDGIFIHMDEFDRLELAKALQHVTKFDYFGPTCIDRDQWRQLLEQASQFGQETVAALQEANAWVQACFAKYPCFTILGI